ncbi:MAG: DNA-binding response regulator [Chloroflexi bacterium RBG_19FT_COMBO_47_15]|nr:MAG: DNA-binding response regulator [Chloroflexi bacterium RBG_19FT_COMBO_47_15]
MKPKTRILIADDHPLLREALCQVFSSQKDMEIVGQAGNGEEAIDLATQLKPDILVMDIMMPKFDGLEASRQIKKITPNTAILILTAYDDDNYVLGLLEAGATGYLMKSAKGQDLVEAVRAVRAGESVLHPKIIEKLLKQAMVKPVETAEHKIKNLLSDREMEMLLLLATGMSNKEIAEKLCLSLRTVKAHMSNIFTKMNVASRSEALVEALRKGLLTLEDIKQAGTPED